VPESIGVIKYSDNDFGVHVECEQDFIMYYRSMLPKNIKLNMPRYAPHITVVRNETIPRFNNWKRYHGQILSFEYSLEVANNDIYWWLPVKCDTIGRLRVGLGLTYSPPWDNGLHITIGNTK